MLIGAADLVHIWTERGDLKHAGEEEGRSQEGRNEEEEVGAPGCGGKGRWTDHLPILSFPVSKRRTLMAAKKKAAKKKKK
jgi:hypothetical protein